MVVERKVSSIRAAGIRSSLRASLLETLKVEEAIDCIDLVGQMM